MCKMNRVAFTLGLSLLVSSLFMLQGCVHNKQGYLSQAGTTPPLILPKGIHTHPLDNQFPVPVDRHPNQPVPSLIPPGSDLSDYAPKKRHRHDS